MGEEQGALLEGLNTMAWVNRDELFLRRDGFTTTRGGEDRKKSKKDGGPRKW